MQNNPNQRVTQLDLAKTLGISRPTISRALARSPLLPKETIQKVLDLAEKMGYRPDPALASLNAYRNSKRISPNGQCLAWMTHFGEDPDLKGWVRYNRQLFEGAKERANQLGYNLEIVSVRETSASAAKALKVLNYRKVEGLIMAPRSRPMEHLRIPLDNFSAVAIGYSLYSPYLDIVGHSHSYSMMMAYRKLFASGYRRIGVYFNPESDARSNGLWRSSYYLHQSFKSPQLKIPILQTFEIDKKSLRQWINKWKLDAIIVHVERTEQLLQILEEIGRKAPHEIGVVFLSIPSNYEKYSGINERVVELGKLAVDTAVFKIRNHDRGVPRFRSRHLLDGEWCQGTTILYSERKVEEEWKFF